PTPPHPTPAAAQAPRTLERSPASNVLIPAGTQLADSDEQLGLLWKEFAAYENNESTLRRFSRVCGWGMLTILLVVLFGSYLRFSSPKMLDDTSSLLVFVGMCILTVFLGCLMSRDPWRAEIIPLLAAVMITAIAYSQAVAILTAFCLSLIISLATVADLGHFVALMTICVSSIIPLRRIKSRLVMIKVGFLVAAVSFYAVWGVGVMQVQGVENSWTNIGIIVTALKFAGWSLVCCYLVAGSLPFIEQAFGVVTDISLLELTGVSHPLLMELARRAPGTYNHSMTVASLAEAAAESIGANGLLTRVGAYFHDIGKMTKPEYFIENMTEGSENHHKSLAPAMSTLIIIGHVKDGLELAEEHNLPDPLRAFIEQHHGTTLVEYFFHEASRKKDDDHRTDADESSFRYPGPKPQSRETAVLMVADAVESASRTLKEPTPKRIQSLVHEITMKRLLDGQFDECNLKMNEIRMIEESLIKSLLAAHHGRVRYPGQKPA
ncbi:MAG: HD family phosphohydrolase, partial [Planctomycetota bacterium]